MFTFILAIKYITINKKTISPIVGITLLVVISVIAVVSFQFWFNNYQDSMFIKVEDQSSISSFSDGIETIREGILYFKNTGGSNITYSDIKIDGISCNLNDTFLNNQINQKFLGSCINGKSGIVEVVVITNNKLYVEKVYINPAYSFLDCSILNGGEWILSPTENFCVMKFEAKFVNYSGKSNSDSYNTWNWGTATGNLNITSSASGGPIAYISQTDAELACQNLGIGYHLMSNAQLIAIVNDAELLAINWNSSIVYNGSMMRGHSDSAPYLALSVPNISNSYDQTGQSFPSNQRRTLNLSNNEVIWDIAGNVWEWTNDNLSASGILNSTLGLSDGWREWNIVDPSKYAYLMPYNKSLTSINSIGQVYVDGGTADFGGGTIHALLRGGDWSNGVSAGAYSLYLRAAPSFTYSTFGFRCTYEP